MRTVVFLLIVAFVLGVGSTDAFAIDFPDISQVFPQDQGVLTLRMVGLVSLLTVLSLAPGLLIMVTSFTRIIVVFSFLRSGLGLQTTPANIVLVSLALFMTFAIMGKPFDEAWTQGIKPLTENKISIEEAYGKITAPFEAFMLSQVREKDLELFAQSFDIPKEQTDSAAVAQDEGGETKVSLRVLIPAFMISELRRGFEMGFLIVLPFLIIDLAVATLTMSMGMMMLPPTVFSLPFKILFFVLMDGWNLLVGSLIKSFQ